MADPKPIFRKGPARQLVRKHEKVIDEFCIMMKSRIRRMLANGEVTTLVAPNLEALLDQRKALVAAVKKGMLERQDQEEVIGILAAMIWFNRQEEARQAQILDY
jgi:hypothetical protein